MILSEFLYSEQRVFCYDRWLSAPQSQDISSSGSSPLTPAVTFSLSLCSAWFSVRVSLRLWDFCLSEASLSSDLGWNKQNLWTDGGMWAERVYLIKAEPLKGCQSFRLILCWEICYSSGCTLNNMILWCPVIYKYVIMLSYGSHLELANKPTEANIFLNEGKKNTSYCRNNL